MEVIEELHWDYNIPTIIPFGKIDTWAERSNTDYV